MELPTTVTTYGGSEVILFHQDENYLYGGYRYEEGLIPCRWDHKGRFRVDIDGITSLDLKL